MAISLRQYTPQVKVSGEGTGVQLNPNLAAQAAGASANVVAGIIDNVADLGADFVKQRELAEQKTRELQKENIRKKINREFGLGVTKYLNATELESNPDIIGTKADNAYMNLKIQKETLLGTIDQELYPELYSELSADLDYKLQETNIAAHYTGRKKIVSTAQSNALEEVNLALENNNVDLALTILETNKDTFFATASGAAEFQKAISEIPSYLENKRLTQNIFADPEGTLKKIEQQRAGQSVENPYNLSDTELKTAATEARQVMGRIQDQIATQFFLNPNYRNSLVSEQISSVEKAIAEGTMPEEQGLAEIKRLQNNIPLEGKHILELANAKEEIRKATLEGRESEIPTIVSKYINNPDLPKDFMTKLMSFSLDKTIITERFSHPNYTDPMNFQLAVLERDQIKGDFISNPSALIGLGQRILGISQWNGMNLQERKDFVSELTLYAVADFKNLMEDWVTSQSEMPSRQEVRTQAIITMRNIREKYNTEAVGSLIEEYGFVVAPQTTSSSNRPRNERKTTTPLTVTIDFNELED